MAQPSVVRLEDVVEEPSLVAWVRHVSQVEKRVARAANQQVTADVKLTET